MALARSITVLAAPLLVANTAVAQPFLPDSVTGRTAHELPVEFNKLPTLSVTTLGRMISRPINMPNLRDCTESSSHTNDENFNGGTYNLQGGMVDSEIAACSYTLPASSFPIRIDMMEMLWGTQSALVQTVTEWSVLVWEGLPNTGTLVAEFSSDDLILPHLRIGPGTAGVNLQVVVDPNDPEQIYIFNTGGSNTFSVGFRIDKHNLPPANPCINPPDSRRNAFMATDTDGRLAPNDNWLRGINCGPGGCPPNGGWARFSALPALCRPTGDWVMRATWTKVDCQPGVGACCLPDGTCEVRFIDDCINAGGVYQGDGTTCESIPQCPAAIGACCNPVGGCLGNLTQAQCDQFGGTWAGPNTDCSDNNGNGIADACEALPDCPADLTGSGDPNDPDYGEPDGVVDAADFFYYLDQFASGNLDEADLTGSGDPNDPDYGIPDGVIDADDFFFYLDLFAQGCP